MGSFTTLICQFTQLTTCSRWSISKSNVLVIIQEPVYQMPSTSPLGPADRTGVSGRGFWVSNSLFMDETAHNKGWHKGKVDVPWLPGAYVMTPDDVQIEIRQSRSHKPLSPNVSKRRRHRSSLHLDKSDLVIKTLDSRLAALQYGQSTAKFRSLFILANRLFQHIHGGKPA